MRKGSIQQLTPKLKRLDEVITQLGFSKTLKKSERFLDRYHELWDEIRDWTERNPDFKSYKDYTKLDPDLSYILRSIREPINIDNFEIDW